MILRTIGYPWKWVVMASACWTVVMVSGCGPSYARLRSEGLSMMVEQRYGPARYLLLDADKVKRNQVENLHDLGFCSVMQAKKYFENQNRVAALRELDRAIEYYDRAIEAHPGYQPALVGKNIALELKGEPEIALEHAEWAVRVVGPSARQYLFLAAELDQRGDDDAAFLRFRQAIAMEPKSQPAHVAFARFLLSHGNESAAVGHLKYAYRLDPSNEWVKDQLASRGQLPPPPSEPEPGP
ncbi:MAG: hypothetical protein ACE5E5_03315 [Phycisphaerae bacterium]